MSKKRNMVINIKKYCVSHSVPGPKPMFYGNLYRTKLYTNSFAITQNSIEFLRPQMNF